MPRSRGGKARVSGVRLNLACPRMARFDTVRRLDALLSTPKTRRLQMTDLDAAQGIVLNDSARQVANDALVWIGFGTVVGLLANGIMACRD